MIRTDFNMSKNQSRVASADNRFRISTNSSNNSSVLFSPRLIRSAGIASSLAARDGICGKSIVNLNINGEQNQNVPDGDKGEIIPKVPIPSRIIKSPRASRLMLGSGKLRKSTDNTENVELHLDTEEYASLVNNQSENANTVDMAMPNENNGHDPDVGNSPRNRETPMPLPKTYATRAGPLLLYSDNKVVMDHRKQRPNGNHDNEIEVQGHRMSSRQPYLLWGKHLQQKKTNHIADTRTNAVYTKRGQRNYIGLGTKAEYKEPYSWNYSVLPMKLSKVNKIDTNRSIKTVNHLSNAVLNYQDVQPTVNEKYLSMIRQTRHRNSRRRAEDRAKEIQKLSTWTSEWIAAQDFLILEEYSSIVNKHLSNMNKNADSRTLNTRSRIQVTLPLHRAPTNTPLSGTYNRHQADDKQNGV